MDEQKHSQGAPNLDSRVLLHNFLNALRRMIWIVLIFSLLFAGLGYFRADRHFSPIYSAEAVISVRATYSSTMDITSSSSFVDRSTALSLSATFPYAISSDYAQMLLKKELNTDVINGSITSSSTAEAALFTVTVTSSDPQDAFDILNAAIKIYPQAASSILGDTQIHVINIPLEPPTEPVNHNTAWKSAVKWGLIALAAGLLIVFLISLTRKTVHSAEDLRKLVNLRCLAYVPEIRMKKHSKASSLNVLITNPRMPSTFGEAVRNLRLKVKKSMQKADAKVLLVTSTLPDEGKTTVATNLSLALAAEGKRVILIDGDLRKQSLRETLGIKERSYGLVEILSGKASDFHLLTVPGTHLFLLSGNATTDQPQPLLDTSRFARILEMLKEKLDYIIIDSPPAGILSDAATTAKYADAALYVVRQDMANATQITDSIQNLSATGVNLIGCVLNYTIAGTNRYGYSSKYHSPYGYKYGGSYNGYNGYGRYSKYGHYGSYGYGSYEDSMEEEAEELTKEINETSEAADEGMDFEFHAPK